MKKRIIVLSVMLLVLLTTTVSAAIDANGAQTIAAKIIPIGVKHLYTKTSGMEYEVQFINETTNTHYEIKVSRTTGTITESQTRVRGNSGSNNIKISEQQARSILLKDYPKAIINSMQLVVDRGNKRYNLKFSADSLSGEYDINPETGVVIEKKLKHL